MIFRGRHLAAVVAATVLVLAAVVCRAESPAQASYESQVWPKGRVLVWAHPGQGGNPKDAANWLENGQPAATAPDKDTDIVLPASPKPYVVSPVRQKVRSSALAQMKEPPAGPPEDLVGGPRRQHEENWWGGHLVCRHVTIESGACLDLGSPTPKQTAWKQYSAPSGTLKPWGNVDVKAGGYLYGYIDFQGSAPTFLRVDDAAASPCVADVMLVHKTGGGSVTLLGKTVGVSHETVIHTGRLVVGPDTTFRFNMGLAPRAGRIKNTTARTDIVYPNAIQVRTGGVLELESGAVVGKQEPQGLVLQDIVVWGRLEAGTPERPLARDARVELTCGRGPAGWMKHPGGLYVMKGGAVRVTSRDPASARLVFTSLEKEKKAEGDAQGIALYIDGTADFDDVLFDGVRKAGIRLADPAARRSWKHVAFGPSNAGDADDLFAALEPPAPMPPWPAWPKSADGKAAWETQAWPAARYLVWARPGTTGNFTDPANWIEDGRVAMRIPDRDTDILMPAADAEYAAQVGGDGYEARHIIVQKNAALDAHDYVLWGNAWVQAGGHMSASKPLGITGSRHTFLRNDNPMTRDDRGVWVHGGGCQVSQYLAVSKFGGASVEFLGNIDIQRGTHLERGTMIVGPDSVMLTRIGVRPEATLRILSGAWFSDTGDDPLNPVAFTIAGALEAGSPERLLTKDAFVGVSFKEKSPAQGLVIQPGGRIRVFSADPTKARLVIQWSHQPFRNQYGQPMAYDFESKGRGARPTIGMTLLGESPLDGVEFRDVAKGGIVLADPAVRTTWKNVFFGSGNAASPEELFGVAPNAVKAAPAAADDTDAP